MLAEIDWRQFTEWQAFDLWEMEMDQRAVLQAKADADLNALRER
jgi:hypothetical protein